MCTWWRHGQIVSAAEGETALSFKRVARPSSLTGTYRIIMLVMAAGREDGGCRAQRHITLLLT